MLKKLFLLLGLGVLIAAPGLAQTSITTTTLTEVVDRIETEIGVASLTGISVGDYMVVDSEVMQVNSLGTAVVRVTRGVAGSKVDNHATGRLVYHEVPAAFITEDLVGACTTGSEYPNFTPLINLRTGNRFTCTGSVWTLVETEPVNFDQSVTFPTIASTAAATLTHNQCGSTVFLDNTTGFATTLPLPLDGCFFRFVDATLLGSGDHTIVTSASGNIIAGGCNELDVDSGDDGPIDANGDTITFVGASDTLGDMVEIISNGTLWFITFCQSNADGGFTIAGS